MGLYCAILFCVYLDTFIIRFFKFRLKKKSAQFILLIRKDHHHIKGERESTVNLKRGINVELGFFCVCLGATSKK